MFLSYVYLKRLFSIQHSICKKAIKNQRFTRPYRPFEEFIYAHNNHPPTHLRIKAPDRSYPNPKPPKCRKTFQMPDPGIPTTIHPFVSFFQIPIPLELQRYPLQHSSPKSQTPPLRTLIRFFLVQCSKSGSAHLSLPVHLLPPVSGHSRARSTTTSTGHRRLKVHPFTHPVKCNTLQIGRRPSWQQADRPAHSSSLSPTQASSIPSRSGGVRRGNGQIGPPTEYPFTHPINFNARQIGRRPSWQQADRPAHSVSVHPPNQVQRPPDREASFVATGRSTRPQFIC